MEPIFASYIPRTAELILPWEKTRPISDLPIMEVRYPEAVSQAEALLDKPVPALPASLYREYFENGNRSRYEALYFARRRNMLILAAAEKTEGKGRFLDLLTDYIWAVCEETSWVIPAHNTPRHGEKERLPDAFDLGEGDDIHYIDLFSAATGGVLAWVWYMLGEELDGLTPVISRRILGLLERRIFHPYMWYHDSMWWKGSRGEVLNNWSPWIVSNVLTAVLLCERDDAKRQSMCAQAMTILDRFIGFYKHDGGCDEGPGYWYAAGASYFDCLELLWDLSGGQIDVFDNPLLRRMGEYIADFRIRDNIYVNFADASHRIGTDAALIARYGRRTGSDKLKAFAAEEAGEEGFTLEVGRGFYAYRSFRNVLEPVPEKIDAPAENRIYYDGLEVFIAREEASGFCLACKGGNNAESHNHNDVGNIILFRHAAPVFIDAGVEQYTKDTFSSKRYTLWTMRSRYHNLPDIGGKEQLPGAKYKAEMTEYTGEGICFDLKNAWPEDTGIVQYTRRAAISSHALTDPAVTVTDELVLEGQKDVTWYWMCAEKPEVKNGTLVFAHAGCSVSFDGGVFSLEVEEFPLTDAKLQAEWKADRLYRIHLTGENWHSGRMTMEVTCL